MFSLLSLCCSFLGLAPLFLISAAIYYFLRFLWEQIPLTDLNNRVVFITGCDSGFGRGIAVKCAKNGVPVFAGCYTEECCKSLEEETSGYLGKLYAIKLDVTKDDSIQNAYDFVKSHLEPPQKLWAILNNAGAVFSYGPDDWASIEQYKKTIDVNTIGVIRVIKRFLPLLKESKGRILTTTSSFARTANVYFGPYSISKYAAEAYMDIIRRELKPWGIKCCIFNPGFFSTPLTRILPKLAEEDWKNLDENQKIDYGEHYKNKIQQNFSKFINKYASKRIDYVVDAYYHAITAKYPRHRYKIGWDAFFYYIPLSWLPTEFQDWLSSKTRSALCEVKPASIEKVKYQ